MNFVELTEAIMVWLAEDVMKEQPTITSTIFSGKELFQAAGYDFDNVKCAELMHELETRHMITPTNKVGPDGQYYNLHQAVFNKYGKNRLDKSFIAHLKAPENGFCIVYGNERTYRLPCEGRSCRYFLATEKKCVKEKFFLK